MAAKKSASRKSAAKKASKTREVPPGGQEGVEDAQAAGGSKKSRCTAQKADRCQKACGAPQDESRGTTRAKTAAPIKPVMARPPTAEMPPTLAELDDRIAIARGNLRDLVEQATSFSGAADEERMSQRIDEQEAKLQLLRKQRKELYPEEL